MDDEYVGVAHVMYTGTGQVQQVVWVCTTWELYMQIATGSLVYIPKAVFHCCFATAVAVIDTTLSCVS